MVGTRWIDDGLGLGAFLGYGAGTADWGQSKGQYDMREMVMGGFLGWRERAAWFQTQLSYAQQTFDVDRNVAIGAAVRRHSGNTDGGNLTLAARGGWDFTQGNLLHGPLLSVVSQSIEVDGYSEQGNQSTSLRFSRQHRHSAVTRVGWQWQYAPDSVFSPYGQVTLDHELKAGSRDLQAQLQSMEGLMPYAVPGTELDNEYATAVAGIRTQVAGLEANIGSMVRVGHAEGNEISVFLSFGRGF